MSEVPGVRGPSKGEYENIENKGFTRSQAVPATLQKTEGVSSMTVSRAIQAAGWFGNPITYLKATILAFRNVYF